MLYTLSLLLVNWLVGWLPWHDDLGLGLRTSEASGAAVLGVLVEEKPPGG